VGAEGKAKATRDSVFHLANQSTVDKLEYFDWPNKIDMPYKIFGIRMGHNWKMLVVGCCWEMDKFEQPGSKTRIGRITELQNYEVTELRNYETTGAQEYRYGRTAS
jgi:hypothetical protein